MKTLGIPRRLVLVLLSLTLATPVVAQSDLIPCTYARSGKPGGFGSPQHLDGAAQRGASKLWANCSIIRVNMPVEDVKRILLETYKVVEATPKDQRQGALDEFKKDLSSRLDATLLDRLRRLGPNKRSSSQELHGDHTVGVDEACPDAIDEAVHGAVATADGEAFRPEWTVALTFSHYTFNTSEGFGLADTNLDMWTVGIHRAARRWAIGVSVPYLEFDSTDVPPLSPAIHDNAIGDPVVNVSWAPPLGSNGVLGDDPWTSIELGVTIPHQSDADFSSHGNYAASLGLVYHFGQNFENEASRTDPRWRINAGGGYTYLAEYPDRSYWTVVVGGLWTAPSRWFTFDAGVTAYVSTRGIAGPERDASQQTDATVGFGFHRTKPGGWFGRVGVLSRFGHDGIRDNLTYSASVGFRFEE